MRRLLLLVLAAGLLSACAAGGSSRGGTTGSPSLELVLFGDPVETAGYRLLLDAFAEKEPGIRVTLSPVATQDQLLARLTTSFAGGRPPDVFLVNYRKYGQFAAQGALEPVQPYLDGSSTLDEDDFAAAALDAFRYDGDQLACMPQNVSSLAVYYNADLFRKADLPVPRAGWTWDDFLRAAERLTGADAYGVGVEPSLIRLAPFVWSRGGDVVDDDTAPTRLTLETGPAREALDWFLDLSLTHGVVPPDAAERSQDAESRFLTGRLGMYLDSRKAVPSLRTIDDFAWDVAPLPVAPGGEPATILHGDAYCMAAAAPHHEAAWKLIEFAMSRQGQTILADSGRTVPSRLEVAESPVFLEPDQPPASSAVFVDAIPTIRAVPHTARWSQAEKEADKVLADIFYGRIPREAGIRLLAETTTPLLRGPAG